METPQEFLLRGVWNLPVWPTPMPAVPVRNRVPTLAPVHGCDGRRMLTAAEMAAVGPWRVAAPLPPPSPLPPTWCPEAPPQKR
jgi:hypothetical protein